LVTDPGPFGNVARTSEPRGLFAAQGRLKVSVPEKERGGQKTERVRVMDWEHPANSDFLLVSQFSVTGALYTCRPYLVGFVNGLPEAFIELKKPGAHARSTKT
jgi:type I restriction enzyme R subunit